MLRLKLLILDAGVVIKLLEMQPWTTVVENCDSHRPRIVADLECRYHQAAGEAESLAYLVKQSSTFRISSGDAIAYKVLGNLNLGDQGISLEEILQNCGLGRAIDGFQYGKIVREKMTAFDALYIDAGTRSQTVNLES